MLNPALLRGLILLGGLVALGQSAPKEDPLEAEGRRRNEALVQAGFNTTYGIDLRTLPSSGILRQELAFPDTGADSVLSFWVHAEGGEAALRLLGPGGRPEIAWSGKEGELTLRRAVPPGSYVLELDASKAGGGQALFGVKGRVILVQALDPARFEEVPADPARGFHWPYLLFVPKDVKRAHLLVVPNNTGMAVEDLALLRAFAGAEATRASRLAKALGCPLLMPLFPRPARGDSNLYLHALSREALLETTPALRRVDLQLEAMIDHARTRLGRKEVGAGTKVLLSGFSASGSFVNRFALLHPDRVLAVACGSPGGWPVAPAGVHDGAALNYPVGLGDVASLAGAAVDLKAAASIPWFFFLGDQDTNDAVVHRDSFSTEDEALILKHFGATPVARWAQAERLYKEGGFRARFRLFPGVGHSVTPEMAKEVQGFFEQALGGSTPAP